MPVSLKCPDCHKAFRVADDRRGKRIKCPGCGTIISIPEDDDEEFEAEPEPVRRTKGGSKGKAKRSKGKRSGMPAVMCVGIAGAAVVAIGLVVWAVMPRGGAGAPGGQAVRPSSSPAQAADDRNKDRSRLQTLMLAMWNHHDMYMQFPVVDQAKYFGPDGRPFLSWRVHLLPYLSQQALYEQFHLNEPWDSPHNKTLIDQMPDNFRSGGERGSNTRMLALTGPHAIFFQRKVGLRDVLDGPSNTAMIVQVGPDKAVPWTKPEDIVFDPSNPLVALGNVGKSFLCAMADAVVREIDSTIDAQTMAAIASPKGAESFDLTKYSSQQAARQVLNRQMNDAKDPHWNQLREIGRAMHLHHDAHDSFPIADSPQNFDSNNRPFLSWRVHLLPFLGQDALYKQFHLNEPWDSPHNTTLIERMPEIYRSASHPGSKTPFLVFAGSETPFSKKVGPTLQGILDGVSGTILVVVVAEDKMVTWTQPTDILFDRANPLVGLGTVPSTGILTLFADGSVKQLKPTIPPDLFKALVTSEGKEVVDLSPVVLP